MEHEEERKEAYICHIHYNSVKILSLHNQAFKEAGSKHRVTRDMALLERSGLRAMLKGCQEQLVASGTAGAALEREPLT